MCTIVVRIFSRVTRATEEDVDPTLPMTESFSVPKRGDTTIEDDEDDSLTSGDGDQSGDGPEPDDSLRFPEKEESNLIVQGSDKTVPSGTVLNSLVPNTASAAPTRSVITTADVTTTTTTTITTTTTNTPVTIATDTTISITTPAHTTTYSTETQKSTSGLFESQVDGNQITSE
jgi:hypothetical protein